MFDEAVMNSIKDRVMDETTSVPGEDHSSKRDCTRKEASDFEMLKTYSTGLLAYFLPGYAYAVNSLFFPFCFIF